MKVENFSENKNKLILEEYFLGETLAWGLFEDRFGNIKRQFKVTINGYYDNTLFLLDEDFEYHDGETDKRIWKIKIKGDGLYEGKADDILGIAQGISNGNALNWHYTMNLPIGNKKVKVKFDDWMLLQSDGVLINRAVVSKWGIKIGTVIIFFEKNNKNLGKKEQVLN